MSSKETIKYLEQNDLLLATAESCTPGRLIALLAEVPGSYGAIRDHGALPRTSTLFQNIVATMNSTLPKYCGSCIIKYLRDDIPVIALPLQLKAQAFTAQIPSPAGPSGKWESSRQRDSAGCRVKLADRALHPIP